MNEILHNQLVDACERFVMIKRYNEEIANLDAENRRLGAEWRSTKKKGFSAVPGVLILVFSSIALWFVSIFIALFYAFTVFGEESIVSMFITVIFMLCAFLIPIPPVIYKLTICRAKNKKIEKQNKKYWEEKYLPTVNNNYDAMTNLGIERDNFANSTQYLLDFVPMEYRDDLAIAYMELVVKTGRAETLKEAMNLYEEQLHRWRLEKQGQQLLEQEAIRTAMMNERLEEINSNQRRIASSLQNIENLEFYNTFCR